MDIKNVSCGNLTTGKGRKGMVLRRCWKGAVRVYGKAETRETEGKKDRRRKRSLRAHIRRTRIFTISTRLRPHTWRLGLTALILKNCRLSRPLLPPTAVPDPFPVAITLRDPSFVLGRPHPVPPCSSPSRPGKRNCAALHCWG